MKNQPAPQHRGHAAAEQYLMIGIRTEADERPWTQNTYRPLSGK